MKNEKTHTTNYFDTFIEVAEYTKATSGTIPPSKSNGKSVAEMQYEMLKAHPYKFTSDEVFFKIYAERKDLTEAEIPSAKEAFFSKGQPCFRASPLTKTYGYGVHSNHEGQVAIVGMETQEYEDHLSNPSINKVKAMRSTKK